MKNLNLTIKRNAGAFVFFWLFAHLSLSQNNITTLPYTPATTNFDTYNPSSQANAIATIPAGWSFSAPGTPAYGGQVIITSNVGGYYAYSVFLSTDYNLGALRDGNSGNITYNVNYTNNTGGLITTLVLSWNYEQWVFANSSGWSCIGTGALAGNTTLPTKNYIGSSSSLFNLPTQTAISSFTLSGLSIANGASFGIAWIANDDTGADNGIAIDDFSMSASSIASITIANGTIPAGNIYQTSTNNVLYRSDVTVSVTPTILNSVTFTTAGTYTSGNLSNLKLWYSTSSVFSASATLLSTRTTGLGAGVKTFTGLTQTFPLGTGYLFLTADVPCITPGNNINVSPVSTSNFTFSNGVKTGSGFTAGGLQTLAALNVSAVSSRSLCSGKNFSGITYTTFPPGISVSWNNSNTNIGLSASGSGSIGAYTAPVVVSNQTAVLTATASNGACVGNSINFSITLKSAGQPTTAWTGLVSGDWDDSDNWSNCVCTSVSNVTIPAVSGPAFNPTLSASANLLNLTISPGATLTGIPSKTLLVRGNWLNNGTFNAQKHCVLFNCTTTQTVSGSSATTFYDVILNTSSILSLGSQQYINGNLQLVNGTFNTNNLLTLTADQTASGRIGPINANADIINNVTIQQLAPGGATGWALFGSSIASPLTMAAWNDNFPITCQNCPDGYNNFPSVYSYDESIAGSYSAAVKYIPITSISDNITAGKGYWVYLGNGYPNTTDITFDVTGTVSKSACLSCAGPVSLSVSYTSNNGITNDGWNLVSNPLPSPISWTALRNGNANVDNAIYVYNTDLNGGMGAHTSYINGVSSNTANGIGDNIAIHQGFYIHATAPTQLIAGENVKVNSNPAFLRPAQATKPIFRLAMNDSTGFEDMSTFYFEQGGSVNFQTDFDAYKLNFDETTSPYLASMSGTVLMSINGLPELSSNLSIPVKAITPFSRTFTFSAQQSDFSNYVCVTLYDSYTGITTNLLTDNYACRLYDTTTASRFTINFFTGSSVGSYNVQQPVCSLPSGYVSAQGAGNGPWNYEWKSGNTVIKTSLNKNTSDTLTNLNGGYYTLKVSTVGQCDLFAPSFAINTIIKPTASFLPETFTTYISNSGLINFTNNSLNSSSWLWDFGDGSGTSIALQSFYNYRAAGVYTVTLISESGTSCKDSAKHVVEVINDVTGIFSSDKMEHIVLTTSGQNQYTLKLMFEHNTDLDIHLMDLKGSILFKTTLQEVLKTDHLIDLSTYSRGLYLLNVITDTNSQKTFKLMN